MISFVICSIDPQKFEAVTANLAVATGAAPYEVVGIHDAQSLCEGYNPSVARARGDVCVFAHDDIEILVGDLAARLLAHLASHDLAGVAGTMRLAGMGWANSGIRYARGMITHIVDGAHDVQLFGAPATLCGDVVALDGVFFARRREVAARIGFDADTFDGWHG